MSPIAAIDITSSGKLLHIVSQIGPVLVWTTSGKTTLMMLQLSGSISDQKLGGS